MQLAQASEDDLAKLAAVLEREAAVVGDEVFQRGADFLVVVAVDGLHGYVVDGSRELDLADGVVGVASSSSAGIPLRGGEGMVSL